MNSRLILRMTAPLVATSLLLLAVGVGTAWCVHGMQQSLNYSLLDNASSMRAAEELEILLREMRTKLDHFLLTGDRKYLEETPASRRDTNRWLTEAERWSFYPREKELATRARAGHDLFYKELQGMLDQTPDASLPRKVRVLIDAVLTPEILQPAHAYLDFNEEEVLQSVRDNQVFADRVEAGGRAYRFLSQRGRGGPRGAAFPPTRPGGTMPERVAVLTEVAIAAALRRGRNTAPASSDASRVSHR